MRAVGSCDVPDTGRDSLDLAKGVQHGLRPAILLARPLLREAGRLTERTLGAVASAPRAGHSDALGGLAETGLGRPGREAARREGYCDVSVYPAGVTDRFF